MSAGPAPPAAPGTPATGEGTDPGCPGCGAPSPGRYCAECGQRQGDLRIRFRTWLSDFLDDTLSLDGTLPRSLWLLVSRPGTLTREWLAGRRSPYTRPFRLYLLASAAFFALALSIDLPGGAEGAVQFTTGPDPRDQVVFERWVRWMPTSMFLLVPVFALFLKMFFARLYFIEHLIAGFHVHAFFFLLFLAIWLLELLPAPWGSLAQIPLLLWLPVHVVLTFRRVYGAGWVGAVLKAAGILWLYLVVAVLSTMAAVQLGIRLIEERRLDRAHEPYFEYLAAREEGATAEELEDRWAEAFEVYRTIDRRTLREHDHYHRGRLELERGRPVEAWSAAREGLREDPAALLPLGLAVRAAWELGAEERARDYARDYLRRFEGAAGEGQVEGRHLPELREYRELARRIVDGSAGTVDGEAAEGGAAANGAAATTGAVASPPSSGDGVDRAEVEEPGVAPSAEPNG